MQNSDFFSPFTKDRQMAMLFNLSVKIRLSLRNNWKLDLSSSVLICFKWPMYRSKVGGVWGFFSPIPQTPILKICCFSAFLIKTLSAGLIVILNSLKFKADLLPYKVCLVFSLRIKHLYTPSLKDHLLALFVNLYHY